MTAFAVDLDGTLIGRDAELRPRTLAAIARSRAAGVPVIVATGRMYRSVTPYLRQAGIVDPVVCYQGAAVVDPRDGTFLLHETLPLRDARDAIEVLLAHGHPPNVYLDDRLFVAEQTAYSDAYAKFQHLEVTEVGDLLAWLDAAPTKLVAVGEPGELPALRAALRERLGDRAFLTTSLPYLLEIGNPSVSKGSGLRFVVERLSLDRDGIVAFGDGENDIDLLTASAYGIAVGDAHALLRVAARWACPGPEEDGVARVIEAALDVHSAA